MSDFHQTGIITTFHRFANKSLKKLEDDLMEISKKRKITLILPSLFQEIKTRALKNILKELRQIKYINEIVVTLGPANEKEFKQAKAFFSNLPCPVNIIWNNGPQIQSIYQLLKEVHLEVGLEGKGRSTWMAFGYIAAKGNCDVIALHDCDIITYSRELLARLIYPIANEELDYEFCKGFYSRITDRMHGRVTRLFITPLIRSLISILGHLDILLFYDSFRYPLAGEFCMLSDLARINRIPADWGLELGVLAEVYRNCSIRRICQSELCENYDHKHQELSIRDPEKGLNKMAIDIAKSLFSTLASLGVVLSQDFFLTLCSTYRRMAQDYIEKYFGDAMINSLKYDRHLEGMAVEIFLKAINIAGKYIIENPVELPSLPNWNRVFSAVPKIGNLILLAVNKDNEK